MQRIDIIGILVEGVVITNKHMKVDVLERVYKPLTKVSCDTIGYKLTSVHHISEMNTMLYLVLFEIWKELILIELIEVFIECQVVITSTKVRISYKSNLQCSTPIDTLPMAAILSSSLFSAGTL